MGTVCILLVDDHPIVRDGVRLLLERAPDLAVVGEAGDGPEALRLVTALRPDVLILDMDLPGLSGVEVARRLRADRAPVRILALSAHDDETYVRGVLDAGAVGYLLKDEARQAIAEAVRGVARGETGWLSRRVAAHLLGHEKPARERGGASPVALTPREQEVLHLIAHGQENEEIAVTLGISTHTVRKHVETIFGKLDVHKRSEAVAWAWARGLVGNYGAGGVGTRTAR
jgi:DNA-binding NarL/FixJ family response regulator